jgi:acyl-CoA reductase-like NAD-dependent aldehyde dehydrogenase
MLKELVRYPLSVNEKSCSTFSEVRNPYNGEIVASVGQADAGMIDNALSLAARCFKNVMQRMPAYKRSEILGKTAQLITENAEDFAHTISLEGGKPIKAARIEVTRAIHTFATASREALNIEGEQIPMDLAAGSEHRLAVLIREPIGIVAAITPFNFPLNMVAHKVAPALAAGNVVILKPSPQTPIASIKLKKLLEQAGLPKDAFQVLPCPVAEASALVRDARLAMLTFTGSTEVGWNFRKEVHPGVRLVLELGGNAGVIIHDDADLTAAASAVCRGGYTHAGQTCISIQRVYVQSRVYDQFVKILEDSVKALKFGNPLDEQTDIGPLINEPSALRVKEWLQEAEKKGAKLKTGGKLHPHNIIEPTIIIDAKPDMSVVCKEIFGPVVSVMKYDTIDDAIDGMNNTRYGLQASVFTSNIANAFKAARRLNAGTVHVNDVSYRLDHMPAGGRKESGLGLEGVRYAIHEMTQPKFICLNLPDAYQLS